MSSFTNTLRFQENVKCSATFAEFVCTYFRSSSLEDEGVIFPRALAKPSAGEPEGRIGS